jgi:CheY-like chemotaxis protein
MARKHKYSVLIADDFAIDRLLLREAIRATAPLLQVVAEVEDGNQVMAYLSGEEPFADRKRYPFPDLLLIDLNMPRRNGFEVLEWLQWQSFPRLKVVVMAAQFEMEAFTLRHRALELGVHHFYSKSVTYDERICSVRTLQEELENRR